MEVHPFDIDKVTLLAMSDFIDDHCQFIYAWSTSLQMVGV